MSTARSFVRSVSLVAGVCALLTCLPPAAAAQGIELTPFVGSFYAVQKYFETTADVGNGSNPFFGKQNNTVNLGARLSVPLSATLTVEGAASYSQSDVRVTFVNGVSGSSGTFDASTSFKGNVVFGSLRLRLQPRRSNVFGLLGGAVVHHGGDAWNDPTTPNLTDFGGVVGFGLRSSVTRSFALILTAEAYIYSFDPDAGGTTAGGGNLFDPKTQTDVLVTVGIPLRLTGR